MENTTPKKYTGGCHCAKVRFDFEGTIENVIACNCSHCHMKGLHLIFVPKDKFTLLSGENSLKQYHFNKKVIDHQFCTDCGVESFAYGRMPDGTPMTAINVRCVDDIDQAAIALIPYDGNVL